MPRDPQVLKTADFVPKAQLYGTLAHLVPFIASVILIPLLPVLYPLVRWHQRKYYRTISVILTRRDLVVRRGVWVREEKTIPIEKITDIAIVEGPLMRWHGVKRLSVETAGQTGGAAALVRITGIVDADGFRDAILEQRDKVTDSDDTLSLQSGYAGPPASIGALNRDGLHAHAEEIVILLRDIEGHMARIAPPPS